jgi:hypothetical protein
MADFTLIPTDAATMAEIAEPQTSTPNTVENINEHTPPPPPPPKVIEKAPEPPKADEGGLQALTDAVAKLGTMVDALAGLIMSQQHDVSPHSVPWTHRGGHVQHEEPNE